MPKLTITTDQEGVILAVDHDLDEAFGFGVQDTGANLVVDAMPLYRTPVVQAQGANVRGPFKSLLAAMMVAFNIKRALPNGLTTVVTLAKLTGGGHTGSLTFTDGILTAKTDPT